ncbi:type II toxin-antitoxin system VapC family toxin [Phormidesmis priestleyi]
MYLLDTNHCSRIILGDTGVINRAAQVGEHKLLTCAIAQGELVYMMEKSQRREANLAVLADFLQDIPIYRIDEETAKIYGQLKTKIFNHFAPQEPNKRRKATITALGFGDNDLWIAAVALQHNLILVSSDTDFQRMQEVQPLSIESWMSSNFT